MTIYFCTFAYLAFSIKHGTLNIDISTLCPNFTKCELPIAIYIAQKKLGRFKKNHTKTIHQKSQYQEERCPLLRLGKLLLIFIKFITPFFTTNLPFFVVCLFSPLFHTNCTQTFCFPNISCAMNKVIWNSLTDEGLRFMEKILKFEQAEQSNITFFNS